MRLRPLAALAAATALAGALFVPANAEGGSVAVGTVSRSSDSATVSGTAAFAESLGAESVGGSLTKGVNEAAAPATTPLGFDLIGARIAPMADAKGLRFIWDVTALPEQVPPEGIRYNWSFTLGGNIYQLQAKRTNIANISFTEDPVGHLEQAATTKEFFQLRGACEAAYKGAPVAGCYHLGFLNGKFDAAAKQVWMELPFEFKDKLGRIVTPDFQAGKILLEAQSATMSITVSGQAVVSNTSTSNYINGWNPYFTGPAVQLGVGPAGASPADEIEYTSTATLTGGTWTGTVTGLDDDNNTIYVRACNGTTCSYTSAPAA